MSTATLILIAAGIVVCIVIAAMMGFDVGYTRGWVDASREDRQ